MAETTSELERYVQSTTKSKGLWEEAKNYLPGGDSRNSIFWPPYPIFVDHASGCHVVDADGTDRLDFIGTMTTLILGHSPKPVVEAVQQQLKQGVVYNAPNANQTRLARLLCQRIPSFDLVRFTNSGTEATLNTIRAARAVTGKNKIAKVEGGYHGSHDQVSVSVRVDPAKAGERSRPDALAATEGLGEGTLDQVVVLPFNETEIARKILEENKDQLSAVIIEPILKKRPVPAAHLSFIQKSVISPTAETRIALVSWPPMSTTVRVRGNMWTAPRPWQLISVTCVLPKVTL